MESTLYKIVEQEDRDDAEYLLEKKAMSRRAHRRWRPSWINVILFAIIVLLVCVDITAMIENRGLQNSDQATERSNSGLPRDTPVAWTGDGKWVHKDQDVENAAWNTPDLELNRGMVALSDDWAAERNISLSQRWPWDKNKGIYLMSSTHDIHCIKSLRLAILNGFDGKPAGITLDHAKHCLSILMQDIMCNADDALQYTGRIHANSHRKVYAAGEGQFRMCRNWSKLRAWADENSACFVDSKHYDRQLPQEQFYKYCPDGSTPWLSVENQ